MSAGQIIENRSAAMTARVPPGMSEGEFYVWRHDELGTYRCGVVSYEVGAYCASYNERPVLKWRFRIKPELLFLNERNSVIG